jgi:hypothetical protein
MPRDSALLVGCEGHLLAASHGQLRRLSAGDLFAVVVVWEDVEPVSWSGWLTTRDRWSVRFSSMNLDDDAFTRWLGDLPGWNPMQLSLALIARGIHLVWRNPF